MDNESNGEVSGSAYLPDYYRSEMSETIGKLGLALAKAQAIMQPATKDKENPFFKSRYADLSSIWDSIRKPLAENELSVIQTTTIRHQTLLLITTLAHSSGEWIRAEYPINPIKNDPQGIGSAITYARRYALAAITGASTEDDDGESATRGAGTNSSYPKKQNNTGSQEGNRSSFASSSLADWNHYKYRYHLPVKKEGKDMEAVRMAIKARGFRFNADDKHWYGNERIEKLSEFLRPLEGATPEPQQQSIILDNEDNLSDIWEQYKDPEMPNI